MKTIPSQKRDPVELTIPDEGTQNEICGPWEFIKVSTGLISDILNYKKGLSKETIRILSEGFKLGHEAFNRPYELATSKKLVES